jgi:hypothetical protein
MNDFTSDLETVDGYTIYQLRHEYRANCLRSVAGNALELAMETIGERTGVWYKIAGDNDALLFLADGFFLTAWQQFPTMAVLEYTA